MKTCGTCQFFSPLDEQCRRNPPTPLPIPSSLGQVSVIAIFPPTKSDYRACGEHRNIEKE